MEPICPLLLAGVSLPLARALKGNETTPAYSNWTSTTSGEDPATCPSQKAVWAGMSPHLRS